MRQAKSCPYINGAKLTPSIAYPTLDAHILTDKVCFSFAAFYGIYGASFGT
jgi:hypothetical protein